MTKTIRLYHGTDKKYKKINLGNLRSFSEGVALYSSKDMTYSMTYTKTNTRTNSKNSIRRGIIPSISLGLLTPSVLKVPKSKNRNRIFYFDCPIDFINNEEDKHIKLSDFYYFGKEMGLTIEELKNINFNQFDFSVYSDIMSEVLSKHDEVSEREKIMKKGFTFMNNRGYNVIEVKQYHRSMTDRFYLIINNDLIEKGNYYEIGEF